MTSNMGPGQETDTEIQTLKDAIDDVVDIYASLGKTQERIVTSIMKKPRTTDMFVAFMSILSEKLNGFTLLELKVKKLEESLKEALCTKKDMLKKQTHLEDQILDILACSTLRDMKTMLKKLVKDREIPTIARTKAAKKSTDQVQRDESILSTNVNDRTIKDRQLLEKADNITDLDITQPCDTVDNIKIEMNTEYDDEMNVSLEHDIEPTLDGITATVSKFKDDTDSDDTEDYDDPGADDPTADEDGADDGEFSLTNVKVEDEGEDVNMADQSDTTPADPSEAAPTEHKVFVQGPYSSEVYSDTQSASSDIYTQSQGPPARVNYLSILARKGTRKTKQSNAKFTCVCNKTFAWLGSFRNHKQICEQAVLKKLASVSSGSTDMDCKQNVTEENAKIFKCKICNFSTKEFPTYKKHWRGHKKQYQCDSCSRTFPHPYELRQHTRIVHEGTKLACEYCSKEFYNRNSLNRHLKVNHGVGISKTYTCTVCERTFVMKQEFKRHQVSHLDVAQFACDKCDKKFLFKNSLKRHKKFCGIGATFQCPKCDVRTNTQGGLKDHMEGKHRAVEYKCICGKVSSWRCSITRHADHCFMALGRKAMGLSPFTKMNNDIVTENVKEVIIVKQEMEQKQEIPVVGSADCVNDKQCRECGFVAKDYSKLDLHRSGKHNIRHHCHLCEESFSVRYFLRDHIKAIHEGKMKPCEICHEEFENQRKLRLHKISVHSIGAFTCEICGQIFKWRNCYDIHLNKHKNIKSFECKKCLKKYAFSGSLRTHSKKCNGPGTMKPKKARVVYKCQQCDHTARSEKLISRHVDGKHSNDTFICKCGKQLQWQISLMRHKKTCKVAKESDSETK